MKKILLSSILITALLIIISTNVVSQQSNPILIIIESPDYEMISKIPSLKTYSYDDDYLMGEIDLARLSLLDSYALHYKIIDNQGWSGEYYVITQRPFGPTIDQLKTAEVVYVKGNRSIIKIDKSKGAELVTAGYQLEKVTAIPKPLPKLTKSKITFPVVEDSVIRKIIDRISADSLRAWVQRLQDFKTRYTYSDSIIPAAQWIYDQYKSFGYMDVEFDTFYLGSVGHRNIIATKPGKIYPDSVIIIGGHYDSYSSGNPFLIAPGAEDNASGTVAAIEAARILANYDLEATVKFAAWDAEEIGLIGSQKYAQQAYDNNEPVSFYLNFDMIGYRDLSDPLRDVLIYTDEPSQPYAELVAAMARTYTTLIPSIPGNSGGSDHRSFQLFGYRAVFGFEGEYDFFHNFHYHQPSDKTDYMDFNYMREVVQMGLATILFMANPIVTFEGKPYVKYNFHTFNDDMNGLSYGNGNGYVDAGETIELNVTVKNFGESTANDVTVTIKTTDSFVTIMSETQSFGSIVVNATATNQNSFVFKVAPTVASGQKINLLLEIKDREGNIWNDRIYLQIMMPKLAFKGLNLKEVKGNGDDKIDPGEIYNLFLELTNSGLRGAKNISSVLKCGHPWITILDSLANFEDIPANRSGSDQHDALTIEVNPNAKSEIIPFTLEISEDGDFYHTQISFNLAVGQGNILLVEDDGKFNLSHYYRDVLDFLGIPYHYWDTGSQGPLSKDTLLAYSRVIWYTGMEFNNSLFKFGTKALENYLQKGGKLFINGSLSVFSVRDSSLMSNFLYTKHANYKTNLHYVKSKNNAPVLGTINFQLSDTGENNQSLTGEIDAIEVAQPILFYDTETAEGPGNIKSSGAAAVAVAFKNYRAVLFSFGWEGIVDDQIRQDVLIKILNWLQGAITSTTDNFTGNAPSTFKLFQNYPNPFNPETTIQFNIPRTDHVTIQIFNLLGQKIRTLINADLPAGQHKVLWSGKDDQNRQVPSGVYFYQMTAGDFKMTRKMILFY